MQNHTAKDSMWGRNHFGGLEIMNFPGLPHRFFLRMLSFAVSVFHLKLQNYLCSGSKRTLNFNLRIMKNRSMLHNGKSKSGTSRFTGMTLIYTIEPFKDPLLIFLCNSDSSICHRYHCPFLPRETVTSTSPSLRLYLIALSQRL